MASDKPRQAGRPPGARPPGVARWMVLILAVPILGQIVLVVSGAARADAVLCLASVEILAAFAVALIWRQDLERLARLTQQGDAPRPRLPEMDGLALAFSQAAEAGRLETARLTSRLQAEQAITEVLPEPLLMVGADGVVRRANEAARQSLGDDIAAVLRHPLLRGAIDRARATHAPQAADLLFAAPVPREIHAVVTPMDRGLFQDGQASILLVDRTRERAVERMRADFVANASHELRTPLASLIGFVETLQGPARDDPPARERFLEIMAREAARMNRLIDDLLSLSRIELSEHQTPQGRIDLGELVQRSLAGFEPRLAARDVRVELTLPELPLIPGDADQMTQVVGNLLDNALKYGRERGCITLTVAEVSGTPWPSRPGVVIAVGDDGVGISRAHLPRLTERFYRVDKGRSRAVGGTGLGLAIVKHIVNRHRGQLVITSEEGQGSRFSVWLPR
ncbi:sensor histidine kinase [Acidisoma cladoniae]|uniref:sensor histidine kinase n=1 Tax=Acidisoma cladoniae TaxID=3040935 RepID=UPI00254DC900|nr:ATP-binding protein [Acidisoma sp. PAMC 29798]